MKTNIVICQGSSCFARGNKENLMVIQKFIQDENLDVEVSFKGQLCTENCKQSPVFFINDAIYTEVDTNKTLDILKVHFKK